MNALTVLISFTFAGLITSCASSSPPTSELMNARQAYARASASPATQLVPADLRRAREALVRAEKSFRNAPQSERTRDLANLAHSEAKMAEALGVIATDSMVSVEREKDLQLTKSEMGN